LRVDALRKKIELSADALHSELCPKIVCLGLQYFCFLELFRAV
jgi:hypothetical protein